MLAATVIIFLAYVVERGISWRIFPAIYFGAAIASPSVSTNEKVLTSSTRRCAECTPALDTSVEEDDDEFALLQTRTASPKRSPGKRRQEARIMEPSDIPPLANAADPAPAIPSQAGVVNMTLSIATATLAPLKAPSEVETHVWKLDSRWLGASRKQRISGKQEHISIPGFLASVEFFDWGILGIVLVFYFAAYAVLPRFESFYKHLGAHVLLLVFWMLMAAVFCVLIYLRQGEFSASEWLVGYVLEFIFLIENTFVFSLIFRSFQAPKSVTQQSLITIVAFTIVFQALFYMGLASLLHKLKVLPHLLGVWLLYVAYGVAKEDDSGADRHGFTPDTARADCHGSASSTARPDDHRRVPGTADAVCHGSVIANSSDGLDCSSSSSSSSSSYNGDDEPCPSEEIGQGSSSPQRAEAPLAPLGLRKTQSWSGAPTETTKGCRAACADGLRESTTMPVLPRTDSRANIVEAAKGFLGERLSTRDLDVGDDQPLVTKFEGRFALTMAGLMVLCVLLADFLLEIDVSLTKIEVLDVHDSTLAYLCFSSSVLATFTMPELYFIAEVCFSSLPLLKWGLVIVVCYLGLELLFSNVVQPPVMFDMTLFVGILAFSALASLALPHWHQFILGFDDGDKHASGDIKHGAAVSAPENMTSDLVDAAGVLPLGDGVPSDMPKPETGAAGKFELHRRSEKHEPEVGVTHALPRQHASAKPETEVNVVDDVLRQGPSGTPGMQVGTDGASSQHGEADEHEGEFAAMDALPPQEVAKCFGAANGTHCGTGTVPSNGAVTESPVDADPEVCVSDVLPLPEPCGKPEPEAGAEGVLPLSEPADQHEFEISAAGDMLVMETSAKPEPGDGATVDVPLQEASLQPEPEPGHDPDDNPREEAVPQKAQAPSGTPSDIDSDSGVHCCRRSNAGVATGTGSSRSGRATPEDCAIGSISSGSRRASPEPRMRDLP